MIDYLHKIHKKYIQKKFEFSQAGQDIFALNLSGKNGTYIEIGAYLPKKNSNTYLLEVMHGWKGISIEYEDKYKEFWANSKKRFNKIYFSDALNFDYKDKLKDNSLPLHINYLSCDIDPPKDTFQALINVIEQGITFDFISFEHDHYLKDQFINDKNNYQKLAREYLEKKNYKVAIDNVYPKNKKNHIYETWYVSKNINYDELDYNYWKSKNL